LEKPFGIVTIRPAEFRRELKAKMDAGTDVVSATFVTPYPPGFPVLVPGQVFSREILTFIRELDTPEIHGYKPDLGYRVYTDKAIENCVEHHLY